jgi:hypothetical protein
MATASQTIDQPTLPSAGSADSLAGVGLATSTAGNGEEINSSKTPKTESQTTTVVSAEEEELRELCNEADKKAKELLGPYHALQVRISGELFPILLRIKTLLPHGEWTPWYENFCKRHHITTSIRTVQRGFAELTGDRLLTDGKPGAKSARNGVTPSKPEAVVIARRELTQLEKQIGTSPNAGEAKQLHDEYKQRLADAEATAANEAVAKAEAAPKNIAKSSPETRVNKRLATIVEVGERYIRVMERVVNSNAAALTERQQNDLQKASESWRKVLRDARELSWAARVIEGVSE